MRCVITAFSDKSSLYGSKSLLALPVDKNARKTNSIGNLLWKMCFLTRNCIFLMSSYHLITATS